MKSKITSVTALFLLGMLSLNAQENKENNEMAQQRLRARARTIKRVMDQPLIVQENKYNHKESEILSKLNTDYIPADFPVFKPEYSGEQYSSMMQIWYNSHPALLKKKDLNEQK